MLSKLLPKRGEHGFTLIELLIVVIIIGVLAAIALPIFINQQKAAVEASVKSDVRNTTAQVVGWIAQNKNVTPTGIADYISKDGKVTRSSDKTFMNVQFTDADNYTVCGYNAGASKATSADSAWVYNGSTGHFSAGDCNLATDGSGNIGSGGGSTTGGGSTNTDVIHTLTLNNDNWDANYYSKGANSPLTFQLINSDEATSTDTDMWTKTKIEGSLAPLFEANQTATCGFSGSAQEYQTGPVSIPQADVHMYDENGAEIAQNNVGDWYVTTDLYCTNTKAADNDGVNADNQASATVILGQNTDAANANENTSAYRITFKVDGQSYEFADRTAACNSGIACS